MLRAWVIAMISQDKRIVECLENLQCMSNTIVAVLHSTGHMAQAEVDRYVYSNVLLNDALDSLKAELDGGSDD